MPDRKSAANAVSVDVDVARVFDAPRELVFEAWTKTEHFRRWFAPAGVDVVACEIDARPGGVIRFAHRFDDGTTVYLSGTFREVVPNERLDFTLWFVDEHGNPGPHPMFPELPADAVMGITVILDDVADGTRVTVRQRVTTSAASEAVVEHLRLAREGMTQTFVRLSEHLRAKR